jgi:hypothetical protein
MAVHYTVISPLEHDGQRYEVGQEVSLLEAVGAALVQAGVLEQGAPPAAETRKAKAADADSVR